MKEIRLIFMILCLGAFFTGCTVSSEKNVSSESMVKNTSKPDETEDTDENFKTRNCMIDEMGNLLVIYKDRYEPYVYDKFPSIAKNLSQIIKVLRESNNIVSVDYNSKLFIYYVLEKKKSQIVGGNDTDIFNIRIDKEQDIVEYYVEHLMFPGLLDDDYRPLLLETFNLLFGESGEDIYRYLMTFYEQPIDGVTDETWIDGMLVTYRCTPKHKLAISLAADK